MTRSITILIAILAAITNAATAQGVRTEVTPDTIHIGDLFHATIQIDAPAGSTLLIPDSLELVDEIESAGRVERTTVERPDGSRQVTLAYPLTTWRTGEYELPPIRLQLRSADGEILSEIEAQLPTITVTSILPIDSAGLDPRPPKDVIGPSRLLWPWILAALTLAAAVAALVYLGRRAQEASPGLDLAIADPASARDRAITALEEVRNRQLLEAGELKTFYSETIRALRLFLYEMRDEWGPELTTAELIGTITASLPPARTEELERILTTADQVKFNRVIPEPERANLDWSATYDWIVSFGPPGQGGSG